MRSIYILGSGGFAKEVYSLIKCANLFEVKGFVDVEAKADIAFKNSSIPVLSEDDFMEKIKPGEACMAMGIGEPKLLEKLSKKFKDYEFPNIIHATAVIDKDDIEFGMGNIITAGVLFTTCIKIGSFNIFNLAATVGHDSVIGNYNVINPAVNISGGVTIGNGNLLGVGSTILQYKNIGNNAVVGGSSLVTKDVEDNITVIGVPAKKFER